MPQVNEYHRPQTLQDALRLLDRRDRVTVPLAGGSWLVPRLRPEVAGPDAAVDAVVDLADLNLSYVAVAGEEGAAWLDLGATTTLADLAADGHCRELAGGLLAKAALREGPVNLRNAATVGGCIVRADAESELVLALVVLDARVTVDRGTRQDTVSVVDVLADPAAAIGRGLITQVRIPWPAAGSRGGSDRVSRTPSDAPIVAVAALVAPEGIRIALGGVAPQPLLLHLSQDDHLEPAVAAAVAAVDPPADFRGSAEYRRAVAPVVARRAVARA